MMSNLVPYGQRYGTAIATVLLSLLLTLSLNHLLQLAHSPFLLFFGAVAFSAYYGGKGPGLVATFLTAIFVNYYFLEPYHHWSVTLASGMRMLIFVIESVLISIFVGNLRTAQEKLQQNFAQLTATEAERARAEAAIAADLRDTGLLRDLSAHLIAEDNSQILHDAIVATAVQLMRADAGTLQILDIQSQELLLIANQGLSSAMTQRFYRINARSHTTCGAALATGDRAFVDFDVSPEADPDGSLQIHFDAGYLSAQSTPLLSRTGKPIGMVSTHWRYHHRPTERDLQFLDLLARQAADLIEHRQAEKEREQLLVREQFAREEAEQANRVKDEFLAILSHELRSPLNPILGWSKLLQAQTLDEEKQAFALAAIERNAKLQTQLIDDLLDVARILRGKLKLEEAPLPLKPVITSALEVVKTAAEAKSIQIHLTLAEVGYVRGDASRLHQIIWNLLANAVKFTPANGHINICLEQIEGQAQITVADTGIGMSPEFLPYVFESFRQKDVSITRKYGGLGLGLSIVKYLVDAHGGTIVASSPGEGQGATFTIRLPLLKQHAVQSSRYQASSNEVSLAEVRVLAVDDNADARELLVALLSHYGATFQVVASGSEALAALKRFTPHVIVCDLSMPGLDGYTLLQQIRATPAGPTGQIPAIAVTACARHEDAQRAFADGFQMHIPKPIEPEKLAAAIAQLAQAYRDRPSV